MLDSAEAGTRLVLVRPADSRNVGAACRAAKTMGIERLFLVGAERVDPTEARITAVHAADLINQAHYCDSVAEAIRGCSLAAAVTRRRGKRRKYQVWTPEQLGRQVAAGDKEVAIVFGNERDGLSDAELEPCQVAVAIPSAPSFPSLNLSHAVQIIAYEIFKQRQAVAGRARGASGSRGKQRPVRGVAPPSASQTAVAADRIAGLVEPLTTALGAAGFFSTAGASSVRTFLVDIFARANIVDREAYRLGRILGNVAGLIRGNHRPDDDPAASG
jgi:TrmH family RNA methyltransferase